MTSSSHPERTLDQEIAAFAAMKEELQRLYPNSWVIFYDSQLQGHFEDFDSAATYAVKKFGRGPYLIRQVGQDEMVLPASVVYAVSCDAC